MASKPITHSVQDGPPGGGFPKIRMNRGLPSRGPPGWALFGGVIAMSCYGFYVLSAQNERKRFDRQEQREARMSIGAFMKAERDLMLESEMNKQLAKEAEIMKDRKDWVVGESVYSKRWQPTTTGLGK